MSEFTTFLESYPEIIYGLCVTLLTFIILKYMILTPTRMQKFLVLLISGTVLAVLFTFLTKVRVPLMILSFLASIGLYEMTIKLIMRKFHITYQSDNTNEK